MAELNWIQVGIGYEAKYYDYRGSGDMIVAVYPDSESLERWIWRTRVDHPRRWSWWGNGSGTNFPDALGAREDFETWLKMRNARSPLALRQWKEKFDADGS